MGLGDRIEQALAFTGITAERVERWLGHPCGGCEVRKRKLNDLSSWAGWAPGAAPADARAHAERMMDFGAENGRNPLT